MPFSTSGVREITRVSALPSRGRGANFPSGPVSVGGDTSWGG